MNPIDQFVDLGTRIVMLVMLLALKFVLTFPAILIPLGVLFALVYRQRTRTAGTKAQPVQK